MWSFTSLLLVSLLSSLSSVRAADQKCYGLNGTELDKTYAPCKPGTRHSGCCAIRRPAGSVDVCLDNGLCMATNDEYMGTIWQEGCTDKTGKDPGCPSLCPDAKTNFGGLNKVLAWNIQMCDYGSYCCRAVNDDNNCCNNATAPKISTTFLGAFQFETSTFGASATTTSASVSTTPTSELTAVHGTAFTHGVPSAASTGLPSAVSATASPPSPDEICSDERKKTAVVGGTLGGILGAFLISALALILYLHKKEKRQRRLKEHYEAQFENSWAYQRRPVTVVVDADASEVGSVVAEKEAEVVYNGGYNSER